MIAVALGRGHGDKVIGIQVFTPDRADAAVKLRDVLVGLDLYQHVLQDDAGMTKGLAAAFRGIDHAVVSLVFNLIELLELFFRDDYSRLLDGIGFKKNTCFQKFLDILEI